MPLAARQFRLTAGVGTVLILFSTEKLPGDAIAKLIRDLADMGKGKLAFAVRCERCRHKAVLLPMSLAIRFGMAHPIEDVYRRLVCAMRAPAQQYFTVWDLAKEQLALAVTCHRCDHRATVQPMTLAARGHGHSYPLSQAKARC
jgi:DNA-directed RNA polymerase subunit RPC12/RpoP